LFQNIDRILNVKINEGPTNNVVLNNFCLTTVGNRAACTKCHAGYGWKDDTFDFAREENVDCLVCHERAGTYVKGDEGLPAKGVDLLAAAKSVGFPRRENC